MLLWLAGLYGERSIYQNTVCLGFCSTVLQDIVEYAGFYNKDNLPAEATRTWVTKTIAETDSDGTTHYITKLADAYKVSGDSFYMQDGKAVLPLGTLTVEETKAPNGYLLDGAYMQAGDKSEQIKGLYVTQITEEW